MQVQVHLAVDGASSPLFVEEAGDFGEFDSGAGEVERVFRAVRGCFDGAGNARGAAERGGIE